MTSMKAAVLYGQGDLRIKDVPVPEIGDDEVLVKVMATGVCGSDLPRVLGTAAFNYPIILGHEFSGVIADVGQGVTGVVVGERMAGIPLLPCYKCRDCQSGNFAQCRHYSFIGSRVSGSWAEYVKLPARNVITLPDGVSFEEGAFVEPSAVALHALRHIQFRGGEEIAVLGGGNIGMLVMQWARLFGAKSITVFDIDVDRLQMAKLLGADYVVNTANPESREAYLEITRGKGFDVVMETAGAIPTIKLSLELAANKGKVCLVGTPTTEIAFPHKLFELISRKEFTLTGSWMSYSAPFPGDEWDLTIRNLDNGKLNVMDTVYKVFPITAAPEAFELYQRPGTVKGKILFSAMNVS